MLFPLPCFAKSYSIDKADINITINSDGSANISETRTYSFSGHFENGEWNMDMGKAKVVSSSVLLSENGVAYDKDSTLSQGKYSVSSTGDKLSVSWKYSATDETRIFTVSYKVPNAVNNFSDTAQFYWKLIGSGWSVSTNNIHAAVHLPLPAPDTHLKAWGHGPVGGKVSIVSPQEIHFDLDHLPPQTFMEGRVVFPVLTGIPKGTEMKLDSIIAEENDYINQTITEESQKEFRPWLFITFLSFTGIILFLRMIYWMRRWWKEGKEDKQPEVNLAGSLHEPPSGIEPAMVEALLANTYKPGIKSITATLLELCRRKIIRITQERQKPVLGIFNRDPEIIFEIKKEGADISKIENGVIKLLYLNEQSKITKTEILAKLRTDTSRKSDLISWQNKVKDDLFSSHLLNQDSHKTQGKLITEMIILFSIAVIIAMTAPSLPIFSSAPEIIPIGVFIELGLYIPVLVFLAIFMDKLTPSGAIEASKWKAFKKYLRDYRVTKNYPLDSVILWEKYIVYGCALGVSLKALSELPLKFGDEAGKSYLYAAGLTHAGNLNFNAVVSGIQTLSTSYGASGSGSSGGFSSGGGGGGGGSGGGMS